MDEQCDGCGEYIDTEDEELRLHPYGRDMKLCDDCYEDALREGR